MISSLNSYRAPRLLENLSYLIDPLIVVVQGRDERAEIPGHGFAGFGFELVQQRQACDRQVFTYGPVVPLSSASMATRVA